MTGREKDLIPTGQPYGERQRDINFRQQTGIPTSSGQGPLSPSAGMGMGPLPTGSPDDPTQVAQIELDQAINPADFPPTPGGAPPADPNIESFLRWQKIAQTSPNAVYRVLASKVVEQLAERIELKREILPGVPRQPVTLGQAFGYEDPSDPDAPQLSPTDASKRFSETMEKMLRTVGHLTGPMWQALYTDSGEFNVPKIKQSLGNLGGPQGLMSSFSIGRQAGRLSSGSMSEEELHHRINLAYKHSRDDARLGAFFSGVLTGFIELGGKLE